MTLINDYQRDNDPKKVINEINDPKPIKPQLQPTVEESLATGVAEPVVDIPTEEPTPEQLQPQDDHSNSFDFGHTVPEIDNNSFIDEVPMGQGIFPSVSQINADTQDQAAYDIHQQQINAAKSVFENGRLTGTIYPGLYEINETREKLIQQASQTELQTIQSINQSIEDLRAGVMQPITKQIQTPQAHNNDPTQPSLDSSQPASRGIIGLFNHMKDTALNSGSGLTPSPLNIITEDGQEFDPFRGAYNIGQNFGVDDNGDRTPLQMFKDTISTISRVFTNPIGTALLPFQGGKFGDYPDGALGMALYGLDLTTNVPISAATDITNKVKGIETGQQPSIVQALLGEDFSFTAERETIEGTDIEKKPLSVFAGSTDEIKTWDDLQNRSWLWKYTPMALGVLGAKGITGLTTGDFENIPDLPGNIGGTAIQVQEFGAGLTLDAITGNWIEGVGGSIAKGVKKVAGNIASETAVSRTLAREIQQATRQVDLPSLETTNITEVLENVDVPPSQIEEIISRDINSNIVLYDPNVTDLKPLTAVEPPQVAFPSNTLDVTGTERTYIDLTLGTDPLSYNLVDVDQIDFVRRTNEELSELARAKGDIGGQPTQTISSRRLEILNQQRQGLYSRYGEDIKRPTDGQPTITQDTNRTLIQEDGTLTQRPETVEGTLDVEPRVETIEGTIDVEPRIESTSGEITTEPKIETTEGTLDVEARIESTSGEITRDLGIETTQPEIGTIPPARRIPETPTEIQTVFQDLPKLPPSPDDVTNAVINSPMSKAGVIDYQKTRLPRELTSRSDASIQATKTLLKNEQVMQDLAEETAELTLKYQQEIAFLRKLSEITDNNVPDLGRRNVFENPDLGTNYTPPSRVEENLGSEAVANLNPLNNLEFFHGTKVENLQLDTVDPVLGAARSELGVGLHLTTTEDLAYMYANAKTTRNLPPLESRSIGTQGEVLKIKPKLSNPVKADDVLTDEMRSQMAEFLNSETSGLSNVAKNAIKRHLKTKNASIESFFEKMSQVGQKYYLENGLDFPETEVLELQKLFTIFARDNMGIDAFYKTVDDQTQLTLLGKLDTNGIEVVGREKVQGKTNALRQAANRHNADVMALEMFPNSSYAKANAADSKLDMMTQKTQRTAEYLDQVNNELDVITDKVAKQESDLRKKTYQERQQIKKQKEERWSKQNETQIKHWNKPEGGIC